MSEPRARPSTRVLLERWQRGDRTALHVLLEEELDWIQAVVRRRTGPELQQRAQPDDLVQDAMVEVLNYGPRFVVSDRQAFRALMARLVENVIRARMAHERAGCRDVRRERPVPSDSVLDLDLGVRPVTRPSVNAQRNEEAALVRLAIELLGRDDREILMLRHWGGLSFAEIAAELGIGEGAARVRLHRAMPRLAACMKHLSEGRVGDLLEDSA